METDYTKKIIKELHNTNEKTARKVAYWLEENRSCFTNNHIEVIVNEKNGYFYFEGNPPDYVFNFLNNYISKKYNVEKHDFMMFFNKLN